MANGRIKFPVEAQPGSLGFTDVITEDEGVPGGGVPTIFDAIGDSSAVSAGGGRGDGKRQDEHELSAESSINSTPLRLRLGGNRLLDSLLRVQLRALR